MIAPGSSKNSENCNRTQVTRSQNPTRSSTCWKASARTYHEEIMAFKPIKGKESIHRLCTKKSKRLHDTTHTHTQHAGFSVHSRWCICPRPTGGDIFSRFDKSLRWHRIGDWNKYSYHTHTYFLFSEIPPVYHTNAKYLQNKLLLISSNSTPKNSRRCLTKMGTLCFSYFSRYSKLPYQLEASTSSLLAETKPRWCGKRTIILGKWNNMSPTYRFAWKFRGFFSLPKSYPSKCGPKTRVFGRDEIWPYDYFSVFLKNILSEQDTEPISLWLQKRNT